MQSFDEADITNVAVVEKFRKKGVATELLEQLFLRGYERGIENFTLEVRVGNAPAIHLYEKLGFERSGLRETKRRCTDHVEIRQPLGFL